jgi:hypothetical protein
MAPGDLVRDDCLVGEREERKAGRRSKNHSAGLPSDLNALLVPAV